MLAILLALASAAGYGGSDYAGGLAARRGSTFQPEAAPNGTAEAGSVTVDLHAHLLQRSSVSLLETPDPPTASRLPSFPVSVSSARNVRPLPR